jgi:hypothetical protein
MNGAHAAVQRRNPQSESGECLIEEALAGSLLVG